VISATVLLRNVEDLKGFSRPILPVVPHSGHSGWQTSIMPSSRTARVLALGGSFGGVSAVSAAGELVARHSNTWYDDLDKPTWTPSHRSFRAAGTVLAAAQAVGAWLVWRDDDERDEVDVPALTSYAVQLGLSLAWSLLFFGLRRPAWSLLEICVLWLAVATTIGEFARRHRYAASLLVPYLGWVTFAAALNAAVWWRNR
jgi:tryptophan-rich sensory protein